MADMCHFSRDRALPFLKQQLRFSSRKSERIWEFYEDISDTVPNPQTRRIEISAQCKSYYIHRAIVNNATQIQGELLNSHRLLVEKQSKHQFDWKYVDTSCVLAAQSDYDYHDSRFRLKQEKVVELLMGNRLYRSELYALRECLQNALDAVEAYARKVANHEACIVVDLGADCVIDVYDNGTGMDMEIIDKHFLSVGESAFWYSDRGIDDWGGVRKNRQLIADHGIGTLSYFMIADRVEIFSIYDHAQQPTHVMLDDYLDGVVFKNTPLTSFPSFDPVDVGVSSPWTAHHGTLVRMHLRRRVHPAEVLRFFARHILRIRSRLLVRTPEGMLELPEIWHLRSGVDDRHTDMRSSQSSMIQHDENQRSMVETYSELFEPKKGFYDNPPKDAAVDDNQHVHRESRYRIRVHVDSPYGEPFRLSQNGIAVEDAEEFFRETENPLLFNAYTVDVDLRGTCFQLNADRSRIQENAYNLQIRNELLEAFTKSYFEQISKIEGAVYFSCGGRYYHGMADVLFSGEPLRISFHPILKKVFQDETRNQEYVDRFMRAFKNAKLYCTGLGRNQPLSVRDIENDLSIREIVVRREKHLSKSLWTSDDHGERDRAMDSFMKAVQSRAANMEMLVYLPGNSESFVLPLAKSLGFSVRFENPDFRILEIQRARAPQESTTQPLLMGK